MAVLRKDGTARVKIIAPGWGSSGYYSPEMLKRDGPKVFTKGLKSFWNHPTKAEEAQRPERDLRDLAGEFITDAKWEESGTTGPGLYADLKVFKPYQEALEELAPHIGMSIRAVGQSKVGEVGGKNGPIIEKIISARSVDAVVAPGAGGKVLQLFEAARSRPIQKEVAMTEEEARRLQEAMAAKDTELAQLKEANAATVAENARLKEGALLVESRTFVSEALAAVTNLPDITKARLLESLAAKPVLKDGALDREAFKTAIDETVKAEVEYVAKLTGKGQITGMGPGTTAGGTQQSGSIKEAFVRVYRAQGKSKEEAEALAEIAAGN